MSSQGRGELRRIDVLPWLRAFGVGVLVVSPVLISGCAVPSISNPFVSSSDDKSASSLADDDKLPEMSSTTASDPANGNNLNCPRVVAWPNERLRTIYQPGHDGDALSVINRGEITKLSRQCQFYGNRVVVKYGVAGRVLLGPKGKPGVVTMPLSVHAAGADKRTLATDKAKITTTIPSGNSVGYFSMVREIAFPVQVGTRLEDYEIFVALK
jgi:hypothetical protein